MTKNSEDDPQAPNRLLSSWDKITKCFDDFSAPKTAVEFDIDLDVKVTGWVFRGLKNRCYKLQPTIEREAKGKKDLEWPSLEEFVSAEFKARARMHLSPLLIPDETFSWLALMQHYAIPTRLLDFTYSPFVALYFAIRNGHEYAGGPKGRTHVRLWAVDAAAVNDRFRQVAQVARVQRRKKEKGARRRVAIPLDPDTYASQRERITESTGVHELIDKSLSATPRQRAALGRSGCVCAASPPIFNPRLVSQQGVFLLNCAEYLGFQDSLKTMMEPCKNEWCMTFDIPVHLIPEIESRLFQMNIHEQALFTDIEGLAGLIRQKARLHWGD
jgi:hypothetical protein